MCSCNEGNVLLSDQQNSRVDLRRRVIKKATIAYNNRHITINCQVRDLTEDGARLRPQPGLAIPDHFELLIDLDALSVPCKVVWRDKNDIGVKFTEEPIKTKPKRLQVVSESTSKRKLYLRKETVS